VNGYYKNWYQHYLELEKEKEKDIQRGYYSNLAQKQDKAYDQIPESQKKEKSNLSEIQPSMSIKKKKKGFSLLALLLPISTVLGFIFLWYQMDIEFVRYLVDEALVFAGIREDEIDVVSYHISLLDQHVEFAELVAAYVNEEDELNFTDLELMYDEIRSTHTHVVEISKEEHAEAVRLWSFKIASINQMMNDLINDNNIEEAHAQFIVDQEAIAAMIREELLIGEVL